MIKAVRILLILPVIAILFACKQRSLVGTWTQSDIGKGTKLKHEIALYSDGLYVDRIYEYELGARMVIRGTYSLKGTSFRADPKGVDFEGVTDAVKKKLHKSLPKEIMEPDEGKLEWIDADSFRFTPTAKPEQKAVYIRKPEADTPKEDK